MLSAVEGPHGRVGAHATRISPWVGVIVARWKRAIAATLRRPEAGLLLIYWAPSYPPRPDVGTPLTGGPKRQEGALAHFATMSFGGVLWRSALVIAVGRYFGLGSRSRSLSDREPLLRRCKLLRPEGSRTSRE